MSHFKHLSLDRARRRITHALFGADPRASSFAFAEIALRQTTPRQTMSGAR
ncbi:MAG: hypothetical protein LC737_05210 [Chloroflexi bacterium]|nr:hypothetical protein [Chloroflexota bacterium]